MLNPPEPTIDQIERDIDRARFEESETERFLRKSQNAYAEARLNETHGGEKARAVYWSGYRRGYSDFRDYTLKRVIKWCAWSFFCGIMVVGFLIGATL